MSTIEIGNRTFQVRLTTSIVQKYQTDFSSTVTMYVSKNDIAYFVMWHQAPHPPRFCRILDNNSEGAEGDYAVSGIYMDSNNIVTVSNIGLITII